jgi:putative Ca2+/H+ antiporter (TMEM165/GDT1 family)
MDLGALDGFLIVFAVVGGFEVFDRTSFALIALAARNRPMPTWVGGAAAFVVTTVLAVSVGAALVDALGPGRIGLVRVFGGGFLLAYAAWLYFHRGPEKGDELRAPHSVIVTAFLTIFLLEIGDTTMIFEIVFVADWGWLIVLVAGALALVLVAAWDAFLGSRLGARLDQERLNRIVVVVLAIVGALTIAYGLAPSAFPSLGAVGAF